LKIRVYAGNSAHHQFHATAFVEGLAANGIKAKIHDFTNYQPSTLAVFWSHRKKMIIENQRSNGDDYLVMECGYLGDREKNISLGFNGLNGHATFPHLDEARGRSWYPQIKPWRPAGDYYLITAQVPGDENLADCRDYAGWLRSLPQTFNGLPVLIRYHPKGAVQGVKHQAIDGDLADNIAGAAGVWTWSSNSAVDALLAGKPVTTHSDGSICRIYTAKSINCQVPEPNRQRMVDQLASYQWTTAEIRNGAAWAALGSSKYD